jgi:hypothetical protein
VTATLPTPTLPGPNITTTRPPSAEETAQAFFDAWKADDFSGMYGLLSDAARQQIDLPTFTRRYIDALAMAAVAAGRVDFELLDASVHPTQAQIGYRQTWHSSLFRSDSRQPDGADSRR